MRLTQPNAVVFSYEGNIKQHLIEPLLFIPFVENAFKYGFNSQYVSNIVFKIKITDNTLIFESHNTIFTDNLPKEAGSSGISIQNVQKRLASSYPNRHELRLNTEERVFYVYLEIMMSDVYEFTPFHVYKSSVYFKSLDDFNLDYKYPSNHPLSILRS